MCGAPDMRAHFRKEAGLILTQACLYLCLHLLKVRRLLEELVDAQVFAFQQVFDRQPESEIGQAGRGRGIVALDQERPVRSSSALLSATTSQ